MRVLGIDPGVTGAWAIVEVLAGAEPRLLDVGDLPVKTVKLSKRNARQLDAGGLDALFDRLLTLDAPDRIIVERLTGAPGVTSTTAFSLGWTAATIDTLLTLRDWDYLKTHPSVWKRALLVPADKHGAKNRATRIFKTDKHWPREKDHNRAEAALIALTCTTMVTRGRVRRSCPSTGSTRTVNSTRTTR